MTPKVSVIAIFEPKRSRVDDFISLMSSMVGSSRDEMGCLRYDFYQNGDGRFYMLEEYKDHDAVEAHRETDHYRSYRAEVVDMLETPISVTLLSPVMTE
jgi:quinol monooxygenase YgiN